jgi:tetratricopeptide (TPR) repeat protein
MRLSPKSPISRCSLARSAANLGLVIGLALRVGAAGAAGPTSLDGGSELRQAQEEIREGGRAYRDGRFAEAEGHYRKALQLDASLTGAALLLGKAIRAQYKPGDSSPQNVRRAREAIAVYQQALQKDPNLDEAYFAVINLLGTLKEEAAQRELIVGRAQSDCVSKPKRAAAYRSLAEMELTCVRGAESAQRESALQCATRGLDAVSKAIQIQEDESAWSGKAHLLRELAKLVQAGDPSRAQRYRTKAAEAQARARALADRANEKLQDLPTY